MTDIAQAVAAYNQQREGVAVTRGHAYGKVNWIIAVLALVLAGIAYSVYRSGSFGGTIGVVIVGVIVLFIVTTKMRGSADAPGNALQATMREEVFPALFSQIDGLMFTPDTKGFFDEIPDGLRPNGNRPSWGDLIEGDYKGQSIAINEISISQTKKRDDRTETVQVFKGVAIRTALAQPVPEIIVTKNRLAVAKWISEKLGTGADTPHVVLDDETFEPLFDVHCSNEGFARAVFSAEGRSRFSLLQSTHAKGVLQLAAKGGNAYLLVEHDKNFFELPPLERAFEVGTDGRRLQSEMEGFLDLIDGVRDMLGAGATEQFRL